MCELTDANSGYITSENEDALYIQEMKDVIETLYQTYISEVDIQYLDTAIEMAEGLAPLDTSIEFILNNLVEIRNREVRVPEEEVESNCKTKRLPTLGIGLEHKRLQTDYIDISRTTIPSPDETGEDTVELFRTFNNMFIATKERTYLDNALGLVEGLSEVNGSIAADIERLRIARDLFVDLEVLNGGKREYLGQNTHSKHDPGCVESDNTLNKGDQPDSKQAAIEHMKGLLARSISTGETPEEATRTLMEIILQDKGVGEALGSLFTASRGGAGSEQSLISGWYKDYQELDTLNEEYHATGDNDLFERAILLSEQIILSAPSQELRLIGHSTMITLLAYASGRTENMDDLQKEIKSLKESLNQLSHDHIERAALLATAGMKTWRKYQQSNMMDDLDEAIELADEAVNIMSSDYPGRAVTLRCLAMMIGTRIEQTPSTEDLARLMEISEAALEATSPGNLDLSKELANTNLKASTSLGEHYLSSYQESKSPEDLEKAVHHTQRALIATPNSDSGYLRLASTLGQAVYHRYEQAGKIEDLNQALSLALQSAIKTPLDDPDCAERFCLAIKVLSSKYQQFKLQDDLDKAIHLTRQALVLTAPGDHHQLTVFTYFFGLMVEKYQTSGLDDDLMEAIKGAEGVILEIMPSDPKVSYWLDQLANLVMERYQKIGVPEDFEQALCCVTKALDYTPVGHGDRPERLRTLSSLLLARYTKSPLLEDLEQAIKLLEEAVTAAPSGSTRRGEYLSTLALSLKTMYNSAPTTETHEKAISRAEEAISTISQDSPPRIELLANLGNLYLDRYIGIGDPQYLEPSIRSYEEALDSTELDVKTQSVALGNLGLALSHHFCHSGDIESLDKCIKVTDRAVGLWPLDQEGLARQLSALGEMLEERFKRFGDPKDLERSIQCLENSLRLTPEGNLPRPELLGSLGAHFTVRYTLSEALEDLDHAISYGRQAQKAISATDPNRVIIFIDLAAALATRYKRLGRIVDLDQAMEYAQLAVQVEFPTKIHSLAAYNRLAQITGLRYNITHDLDDLNLAIGPFKELAETIPKDSPYLSIGLRSLGNLFCNRYTRLGDLSDLENAIKYGERSLTLTPRDHPSRAGFLNDLSRALSERYEKTKSTQDYYHALHTSIEAWHCYLSPPDDRLYAAINVSCIVGSKGMFQQSSSILQDAVKLLPRISRRSLRRCDQERRLSRYTELAAQAVSVSLTVGEDAMFCLRILEFGRGIITGLIIDCRNDSDLSELRLIHPEVFVQFDTFRKEIDAPIIDAPRPTLLDVDHGWTSHISKYQQAQHRREQAVYNMDVLLAMIRELPGFEGFQLPPRPHDLMAMASEGPVIIFNCTEFRTDAIIVTSTHVKSHPLPKVDYKSVKEWMGEIPKLVSGKRSTYQQRNERMEELLLWLWDDIVEPILDRLMLEKHDGELPRVWWIGTGGLAMAPFHAAGDHCHGSTRNTMSRVISSYIPTMKALSFSRRKELNLLSNPESRLLLVTMPTTPSEHRADSRDPKTPGQLTSVLKEVEGIISAVKGKTSTAHLNRPSADHVLKELTSCDMVHFACHGVSNRDNPSESHLLLRKDNDTEEGALDRLSVEAISNKNIENAQIAYLSACSTADNSSKLGDESIYIASAFQLAGFSHVLATQWVSNDVACRQVAEEFYKLLFSGGKGGHRQVSVSFHHAVKRLREKNLRQPIKWACYIHTGA